MKGNTESYIKVLEHLSYVIESLALDYTGEAKRELGCLIDNIRDKWSVPDSESITKTLEVALNSLLEMKTREGAGHLSSISRKLWSEVI